MDSGEEKLFLRWDEAFRAGPEAAGGKGWNLGRLDRYGFDLPAGGVLSTLAYGIFIEANKLQESLEDVSRSSTAEKITNPEITLILDNMRGKINNGIFPPIVRKALARRLKKLGLWEKPVAVRSSASAEDSQKASFAGMHDSFLNVKGLDNILESVKACYASLWTPRAVAYRRKMNISDNKVLPAVVIMQMVEARAAGIAFSCDPRTGREDLLVINANYGLGESVVGGLVEPDQYLLDTTDIQHKIKGTVIGSKKTVTIPADCGGTMLVTEKDSKWFELQEKMQSKQVLSNIEITRLGLIILRVLDSLGEGECHQDIEWALDGEKFYLVQARPVTALPQYTYPAIKSQPEIWSNANTRDALPVVLSTLAHRDNKIILTKMMDGFYKYLGVQQLPGIQRFKCFNGRLYANMSVFQWEAYKYYAMTPAESNHHMGGHQQEITIPENQKHGRASLLKIKLLRFKLVFLLNRLRKKVASSSANIRSYTDEMRGKDLTLVEDKDLLNYFMDLAQTTYTYSPMVPLFNLFAGGTMMTLTGVLENYFPTESKALISYLMAGAGNITSATHGYRLIELAELAGKDPDALMFFTSASYNPLNWEYALPDNTPFKQVFKGYIKDFGHRAVYEADTINPRWRENPSYLLNTVKTLLDNANTASIKAGQEKKRKTSWDRINTKLPFYLKVLVKYLVSQLIENSEMREMTKSEIIRLAEVHRKICLEIAGRLVKWGLLTERDDIFHCSWYDIIPILTDDWDGRGLQNLVSDRKKRRKELEALSPPDLIINDTPVYSTPLARGPGDTLEGLGVAAGKASGQARIVMHPEEGEKLGCGEVLAAPSTDPAWTPLFLKASAIVMETGGFLSHGAIVAREYGIPAVVNIPGVLKLVQDGQETTVDGDEGKIYLKPIHENN